MYLPGTTPAFAAALLLGTGLAWAADPVPVQAGQAASEPAAVFMPPVFMSPMQAWPNMMPLPGGMLGQIWAPPPGMMWPMPPSFPPAMMMPPAPQITWMPFVWVMVPQPLPPGMNGVSYGPVADTPVVKLDSPVSQTMATGAASLADGGNQVTAPASMRFHAVESVSPPPVVSVPDAPSKAVPAIESKHLVTDAVAAQAKQPLSDALGVSINHAVSGEIEPLPISQSAPGSAASIVDAPVREVDYGPVAPTPIVDLLALMPSVEPVVKVVAPMKKQSIRRTSAPVKKRTVEAASPAKPRMCWTQGVVAPCR